MSQLGLLGLAATRQLPLQGYEVVNGDMLQVLAELPPESVDAVVTDPPYELGFMGKAWDKSGIAVRVEAWRACLRVLKPGGYLLSFAAARNYHRMAVAIEDAAFDIVDQIDWLYGSGFPKNMNLGDGRGTALKPGHEPICMAQRPVEGTIAGNLASWGTGAINIDECRIPTGGPRDMRVPDPAGTAEYAGWGTLGGSRKAEATALGRWPSNVMMDTDAAAELDAAVGTLRSGANPTRRASAKFSGKVFGAFEGQKECLAARGEDEGGPSRFFYVAKPARSEKDFGLKKAGFELRTGGEATDREEGSAGTKSPRAGAGRLGGVYNDHPTVKPIGLMRQLVRLVTPPGGIVVDPFTGSGTTGVAAMLEDRRFFGVDLSDHYVQMALARIRAFEADKAR